MGDGGAPQDKSVVPCNEIDYRPRPSLPYDVPSLDPGSRYAESGTFLRGVLYEAGARDSQRIVGWFNMAARHANILKWMVFLFLGAVPTDRNHNPLPHPPPIQTAILNRLTNMRVFDTSLPHQIRNRKR